MIVINKRYFLKVFFIFLFFIYIKWIPIINTGTDIQFYLYIIATFIVLIEKNIKLTIYEIVFSLIIVYSLLRIDIFIFYDLNANMIVKYFKVNISLLFSLFILYITRKYFHVFNNKKIFFTVIKIFLFIALLQWLSQYFHILEIFNKLIGFFLNRENNINNLINGRGVSILTCEPSFAGMLLIIMLLIHIYNYKILNIYTYSEYLRYGSFLIILIILTKAATSYVLLFFLFSIYILVYNKKMIFYILALLPILFFLFSNLYDFLSLSRGGKVVFFIFNNPAILLEDKSITARLVGILAGVQTLFSFPFGYGAGVSHIFNPENSSIFNYLYEKYNIYFLQQGVFQSLFGEILTIFGYFGLFFILSFVYILLFKPLFSKNFKLLKFTLLVFPIVLFQFFTSNPISFPYIWLMMGIVTNYFYIEKIQKRIQIANPTHS